MKLLSRKNIVPSFEGTEIKITCLPDLSEQKWEVYEMPSILLGEEGLMVLALYCISSTF
jgi:hypothetical protein